MRFIFLLTVLIGTQVFAQRGIIHYSKENGLTSNEINALTYDNHGFLWLATNNGIDRFDGQRFVHFKHNPTDTKSIIGNTITAIVFDGKETIYAGEQNKGLIAINTRTFQVKKLTHRNNPNWLSGDKINALCRDVDGTIWIAQAGKGLDCISSNKANKHSAPSQQFSQLNPFSANTFHTIVQDKFSPEKLWCLSDIGLFCFNKTTRKWTWFSANAATLADVRTVKGNENMLRSIAQDGKGNFYIGTQGGDLLYFDQLQKAFRLYRDETLSSSECSISGLAWRDTRYLYVCGLNKEFLLFDTRTKDFLRFEDDERYDIQPYNLVRHESQLAICSKQLGLFVHNEAQIFGTRHAFPEIHSVCANQMRSAFLMTFAKEKRLELRSLSDPTATGKTIAITGIVKHVIAFGKSDFLVQADNRLIKISKNGAQEQLAVLPTGSDQVLLNSCNSTLMVYHPESGIYVYNLATKKWKPIKFRSSASQQLWAMRGKINQVICFDHVLYMAGSEGLFVADVEKGTFVPVRSFSDAVSDEVTTMHHQDGILWLGTTASGLFGYSVKANKIIHAFDERTEFPTAKIEGITSDTYGNLWVRTPQLVVKVMVASSTFAVLNESNGLANVKKILCAGNSIYFIQQSSLVDGLLSNPMPVLSAPDPYIQRVLVLNNATSELNLKLFSASQNSIQFEFGVLDFGGIGNNKVQYRLVGLDDTWRTGSNRDEVSYYNLPGGTYRFEIRVMNDGKSYVASYPFTVLNPFYLRWWFLVLSTIFLVSAIWFYIRLRIRRIETTERMKARFSADLNEMESKALQAQMNPHFLFNSLNSIRLFVLKNEVDSAANYIAKFSKLLRMILNYSRQDMITVYDEIQAMKLYLDFERLRFDNGFEFDIEIDGQAVLDCQIPPLIVQPFIENAIWHGLMARTGPGGYIHVAFKLENNGLRVTVEDNGIGRDKAKENNSKRSLKEGSVGLQITKERLKGLSFRTQKQNDLKIIDLFDENHQPKGTLVNLYFEL